MAVSTATSVWDRYIERTGYRRTVVPQTELHTESPLRDGVKLYLRHSSSDFGLDPDCGVLWRYRRSKAMYSSTNGVGGEAGGCVTQFVRQLFLDWSAEEYR